MGRELHSSCLPLLHHSECLNSIIVVVVLNEWVIHSFFWSKCLFQFGWSLSVWFSTRKPKCVNHVTVKHEEDKERCSVSDDVNTGYQHRVGLSRGCSHVYKWSLWRNLEVALVMRWVTISVQMWMLTARTHSLHDVKKKERKVDDYWNGNDKCMEIKYSKGEFPDTLIFHHLKALFLLSSVMLWCHTHVQ